MITFANSLDPDQDPQNICADLFNLFDTLIAFMKECVEKVNFEKISADNKSTKN